MKSRKVESILLPYPEDLPSVPSVPIGERITRAIELMMRHDIDRIAVVRDHRPIGMVRLEDAFQELGLEIPER